MSKAKATKCYAPLQRAGLTVAQENAIDALVSGKTDTEAAALVGVNRVTVTRWRLYSPTFMAALNVRRAEVWSVGAAQLRALIPKAIGVLASELEDTESPNRIKAALELLRLVPLTPPVIGPADPEEIVRRIVHEQRANAPNLPGQLIDEIKGLPPFDEQLESTWQAMEARAYAPALDHAPELKAISATGSESAINSRKPQRSADSRLVDFGAMDSAFT